jgi:CheY-like chemotaxis protein
MPIVDGITSTRMIRKSEHKSDDLLQTLSTRARLNGRVPIIAVSASLLERERQIYIDAGFDAWILKPISFSRLSEIMGGIVDGKMREDSLYVPGEWERGGWFKASKVREREEEGGESSAREGTKELWGMKVLKSMSVPSLRSESDETVKGVEGEERVLVDGHVQSPEPME